MCAGKGNTNCQCDGNCQCGKEVAPGIISCHNCGWKAPLAYSTLGNKFVCPSCRTESPYSINVKPNNKNKMNQNLDNSFTQGMVAIGTGFPGAGFGVDAKLTQPFESSFADISSQKVVGYTMGQQWPMVDPFKNYAPGQESSMTGDQDDAQWLEIFNQESEPAEIIEMDAESAFKLFGKEVKVGDKLKSAFVRFHPAGILIRDSYCGKYCKSLGYARKADKQEFKKCKAACKVNYLNAKKGSWKYPAAPEGIEEDLTPEQLGIAAAKEVAKVSDKDNAAAKVAAEEGSTPVAPAPAKSKMWIYIAIGVVVLAVIIAIIMMMRKRQAAA